MLVVELFLVTRYQTRKSSSVFSKLTHSFIVAAKLARQINLVGCYWCSKIR